jgi:hypothetical protein
MAVLCPFSQLLLLLKRLANAAWRNLRGNTVTPSLRKRDCGFGGFI